MGLVYSQLNLSNPRDSALKPVDTPCLVDSGSLHLVIPQHIATQLRLEKDDDREVTIADGTRKNVPYVGPIKVKFDNRQCYVGAIVMGDEVLLGAVPMEDMDLVVVPGTRQVMVNPLNPNIACSVAKGIR